GKLWQLATSTYRCAFTSSGGLGLDTSTMIMSRPPVHHTERCCSFRSFALRRSCALGSRRLADRWNLVLLSPDSDKTKPASLQPYPHNMARKRCAPHGWSVATARIVSCGVGLVSTSQAHRMTTLVSCLVTLRCQELMRNIGMSGKVSTF